MKTHILLLLIFFSSCTAPPKNKTTSETTDTEVGEVSNKKQMDSSSNDLEPSTEQVGETNSKKTDRKSSLEDLLPTTFFLDILEANGVSREEMEKLVNNPDSLRILAQKAQKQREATRLEKKAQKAKAQKQREATRLAKKANQSKGKISEKQLASKDTPTGVSLEEAILIVQAESGLEATVEKLKKIDSLAGTNVMQQMDFTEADRLLSSVERKNEVKASPEEEKEMKALKKQSGQMHSVKEAKELFAKLEKMEQDIASGALTVSPKYQRTITQQKNRVKIFRNDMIRKATVAQRKFQKLNPDLYFGEDVGATYRSESRKMVYLPLGPLSFADKVVKVKHPKLLIQQVKNVLGEPDVIHHRPNNYTGIHSLGLGGELTIQFMDNALTNVNGPDLYIFEIGAIEPTDLEISKDGKTWIKVGKIDGGTAEVDIAPFVKKGELFYYVRLTDLKTKSSLPGADVDAIAAIGAAMRLSLDSKVLFDTGKSELKPVGKEALKELANNIKVLKSGSVLVEGHTDDVGSKDSNQKLSLARAKSVSAELKKLIPSSSFKWQEKGLGESKPLVENDSDANRSKNRRVEVLVLPN